MPHIHTQPGQHDMTVSAYVLRYEDGEWLCMVHWHRKADIYLQIGGHIELDQSPWQAIAAELMQESGYALDELKLLQPQGSRVVSHNNTPHPVPFSVNTYDVGDEHYHVDLAYGFIADAPPKQETAEGESNDLRWYSSTELDSRAKSGEVVADVVGTYELLIDYAEVYDQVSATDYSLQLPSEAYFTYKRGRPSESRKL